MNFEFFSSFYNELISNEFYLIKNFYDSTVISNESKYIGLFKQIGPMVYIVNIINTKNTGEGYKDIVDGAEEKLKNLFGSLDARNIIFVNILITDNPDDNLLKFSDIENFDIDSEIIQARWIVNTVSKDIIVLGNQPDKLLNINALIYKSLNSKNVSSEAETLFDVIENKKQESKNLLKSKNAFLTYLIILINVLVYVVMEFNGGSVNTDVLISFGALEPSKVVFEHEYYRLFTSAFLHIGFLHLLANSFSLYLFGTRCERYFGKAGFIIIYILSAIAASIASVTFSFTVAAGASGAIFGLLGALLAYCFIKGRSVDGFNLFIILTFSIFGIASGFLGFNVDNSAHIGGFLSGCLLVFIYLKCICRE